MYDIFGKYGALRQIRLGDATDHTTRGTAYVVYEDIFDAKNACEHLNGFQVAGRYIVVRLGLDPRYRSPRERTERRRE
jgi:pre-mRNA branch site protein p14